MCRDRVYRVSERGFLVLGNLLCFCREMMQAVSLDLHDTSFLFILLHVVGWIWSDTFASNIPVELSESYCIIFG